VISSWFLWTLSNFFEIDFGEGSLLAKGGEGGEDGEDGRVGEEEGLESVSPINVFTTKNEGIGSWVDSVEEYRTSESFAADMRKSILCLCCSLIWRYESIVII